MTYSKIAKLLGRTLGACQRRGGYLNLGLARTTKRDRWTEDEEVRLTELRRSRLKWLKVTELLRRSTTSCKEKWHNQLEEKDWTEDQDQLLLRSVLVEARITPMVCRHIPGMTSVDCSRRWKLLKNNGWDILYLTLDLTDRALADLMLKTKPHRVSKVLQQRWEVLLTQAECVQNSSNITPESEGSSHLELLYYIINSLSCKTCHRFIRNGLVAHDCVACGKEFEVPEVLAYHYQTTHNCDIEAITVEGYWAEINQHLFPQLDLHTGYGRYLTTRSPVSALILMIV